MEQKNIRLKHPCSEETLQLAIRAGFTVVPEYPELDSVTLEDIAWALDITQRVHIKLTMIMGFTPECVYEIYRLGDLCATSDKCYQDVLEAFEAAVQRALMFVIENTSCVPKPLQKPKSTRKLSWKLLKHKMSLT